MEDPSSGYRYEGAWENDRFEGEGRLVLGSGEKYEGAFQKVTT